jgi:hypothetical protein
MDVVVVFIAVLGPINVDALTEPECVGKLPIGLEQVCIVIHVLEDGASLIVLVVVEADKDDVPSSDLDLLVHLAPNMVEACEGNK